MTLEEAKKAIDGFKEEGMEEEEILVTLHDMYRADKLTLDQFEEFIGLLGYEFTDDFRNMSDEEKKEQLYDEVDEESEESEESGEDVEDLKEIESESESAPKEESEEEKARKLFGLDK